MFEFRYYLENELIKTESSNEDVVIFKEKKGNHFKVTIKALKDITLESSIISFKFAFSRHETLFVNGYQSWTDTKEHIIMDQHRNIKKFHHFVNKKYALDKYGDSSFVKYQHRVMHGIDVAYIRGFNNLFIGSINYENAYLVINFKIINRIVELLSDIKGKTLKAGEEFVLYNYYMDQEIQNGFKAYIKNFSIPKVKKIIGYTSWYNHYQNINETIIYNALKGMDSSTYNLFQIDDGYETYVGDWLDVDPVKFPAGLKGIVDDVHAKGLMAGIWLAPFVAEEKSKLFKEHPEFIKRDEKGKMIKAGGNWSGFYPLDLEREDVKAYIRKCLEHYMNMGFDFFKLDFLYACNLGPSNLTRAERSQQSYAFLRETLKNRLILGCGAIISNSYKNFDYLRIGPDVSLKFDDTFIMRLMHRERISTKVTIQNTIFRSMFDGFLFGNDPDVFLLRDDNIKLTKKQKESLIIINAIFGSLLMTSDNISEYDEEKKALLARAINIFTNATDKFFQKTSNNRILIRYRIDGELVELKYNSKKGVLIYGQKLDNIW